MLEERSSEFSANELLLKKRCWRVSLPAERCNLDERIDDIMTRERAEAEINTTKIISEVDFDYMMVIPQFAI